MNARATTDATSVLIDVDYATPVITRLSEESQALATIIRQRVAAGAFTARRLPVLAFPACQSEGRQ